MNISAKRIPKWAQAVTEFKDHGTLPDGYEGPLTRGAGQELLERRLDEFKSYQEMDNGPKDLDPRVGRIQVAGAPEDGFEELAVALSQNSSRRTMTIVKDSDSPADGRSASHTVVTPRTVQDIRVSESDFDPTETTYSQMEYQLATSSPTPIGSGSTTVTLTPQVTSGFFIVNDGNSDEY